MLVDYVIKAMKGARLERIEDGTYFGSIPRFKGVWANAKTRVSCRRELQEVLEEWIVINLRLGATLPRMPGVRPFPPKRRIAG